MSEGTDERTAGRAVRSYRDVFTLERRLFRIDRWQIPLRGGIEVRAIVYAIACYLLLLFARAIPPIRLAHDLLPGAIGWVVLPLAAALALARFRPDGRVPHHAAASVARWALSARRLAGLRPERARAHALTDHRVVVVGDFRDAHHPIAGSVCGPALVTVRRAARLTGDRRGARLSVDLSAPPVRCGQRVALGAGERLEVDAR